LCGRRLPSPP
jgi:hypothetical protein